MWLQLFVPTLKTTPDLSKLLNAGSSGLVGMESCVHANQCLIFHEEDFREQHDLFTYFVSPALIDKSIKKNHQNVTQSWSHLDHAEIKLAYSIKINHP